MIVNELITNSFKYAFVHGAVDSADMETAPRVDVRLFSNSSGTLFVEVSDNGEGAGTKLPAEESCPGEVVETEPPLGLGTRLIGILARQLDARITKTQTDGWTVRLEMEA